jgi:hypothetical protein
MSRTRCTPVVAFSELVERLEAVGLSVGVERHAGRHVITVLDPDSCRSIRLPVYRGFDDAATLLVLSGRLREMLGMTRPAEACADPGKPSVSGRWPELMECWPEL